MVGSVSTLQAVWSFSDVANGLMAVPNLISLLALNGVIVAETRDYLWSGNLDKRGVTLDLGPAPGRDHLARITSTAGGVDASRPCRSSRSK